MYWKRNDISGGNHARVGDIDGKGHPTVFVASEDVTNGSARASHFGMLSESKK
jgi:hypothetical protein